MRYYRDVMGLKLIKQDARVASFRLGDDSTELVVHSDRDLPDQALYYLVDSVKDLYARRDELRGVYSCVRKSDARELFARRRGVGYSHPHQYRQQYSCR